MSGFDEEDPTKRVKMVPNRPVLPTVPKEKGFSRDETSSILVDSEAIVEERCARPPAPPLATPGPELLPSRKQKATPVPKAQIFRGQKSRVNRD